MSTQTPTETKHWYDDTEGHEGGWLRIRQTMQEIWRHDVLDGDEPTWERFSRFVQQSLSQELYGEFLSEGGWNALGPMWAAFRDGWLGGAGQYGGLVRALRPLAESDPCWTVSSSCGYCGKLASNGEQLDYHAPDCEWVKARAALAQERLS